MKKTVVVDYRINAESVKTLEKYNISVIKTVPVPALYDAVNGHPDMQLHYIGNKRLICANEAYEYYKNILVDDYRLICGAAKLKGKYPYDILYNTAVIGNYAVCNEKYTAPEILEEYKNRDLKIINVKQGYSKCSIAVVSDNAAITADNGIYSALTSCGIDVLKINSGNIRLDGMSYGFIGGCCGLIDKKLLAFNGNVRLHPESGKITDFCKGYGVKIVSLNDEPLYDIGSIILI